MRVLWLASSAVALLAAGACQEDRERPEALRLDIQALERERDRLRKKVDELMVNDPRLQGMPETQVRVGVPTTLVRDLAEKVVAGFVDQVGLELKNLRVKARGKVTKVVTIGTYDLDVLIKQVKGRLRTGKPEMRFGGNKIEIRLPVTVASGSGRATIHFKWDGKNVAGGLCGDLDITREVSGSVKPDRYSVQGGLVLTATAEQILATPRFPVTKINLKVVPSAESWATMQAVLDEKKGLCGYVLEKVDVLKLVRGLLDKGFDVRLPTEKLKPVAVPVGIEPSMTIRGKPVALAIKLGGLAITERELWLGAEVAVER